MFDRLLDLLQATFRHLIPWVVLNPYEQGVLVRLGRYVDTLEPGFHWCWPFGIDAVFNEIVMPRTEHLRGLSTTTADDKSVGFDVVVTYRIHNIRRAILEVHDLRDAIIDTVAGYVGTALATAQWEEIRAGKVIEQITADCRQRGFKWGVEILAIQFAGVALVRNIRLSHHGVQPAQELHLTPHPG
jgi:regulator of protease activity HflC (stomatin/prohibitin superfamily)